MGIGPRLVPNVEEELPAAALMHEVRLAPTPLIIEDSPEPNEDNGGGIVTPGSPVDGELYFSAVLPVADLLLEERVVSTLMVTEESPLADEDVAGSIATLASPTQMVKSLPDLQKPAQLSPASLDNAISPLDASDPIQPAIIPQKKLGRIILTTEEDGGKFAKDCEAEEKVAVTPSGNLAKICETKEEREEAGFAKICEAGEDAVVNPLGNHPKRNPARKNKKPGRLLSHFQDWLEDKSAGPELPKVRRASSASNSPAALSYRPWNQSIMLSTPSRPADLEVIQRYTASSSSSRGDHNNGSREADGYQVRAPPPRSYQNDDTGTPTWNLLMAVTGVKIAVNHFAKVLITSMNKHPVELEYLKQSILREVRADMDRAHHWKFLVQAFICKRLFDGFDAPNRYFGVEYFEGDQMTKFISFADFFNFKDKASTISKLLDSDSPDGSFLGRFCFKKFKSIIGELGSNQPLPIYQEEWSAVERERHPKTVFYQSFLKVAVSVWLVHRLVHSFEEKVEMLIYEKGAKFQRQTMESVVPGIYEEEDEEADLNSEVGFSVIPGFQVSRCVVKCEVYLRSRNRHTDMESTGETSTEKTPVKTAGKPLSGKTSVKLHAPEMPVRDNNSPGSLQTSDGFTRSSHYADQYPPTRVGDDGSSDLAVREAGMFPDVRRESLNHGNQGSVTRSCRKNRNEQDNFSETLPGSHGHGTIVYKMPAPSARSSNVRGPNYPARHTLTSARRRQENTRQNSPSV